MPRGALLPFFKIDTGEAMSPVRALGVALIDLFLAQSLSTFYGALWERHIEWAAEIYRKEGNDNDLHDSIRTTNGDGDDAARERNPTRTELFLARGSRDSTHVFAHELGRGHRRTRPAAAPHALEDR